MALESFKRINDLDLNPEKDLIQIYNKKTDTMGVINPSQISTPLPAGVLSVDNPLSSTLQPIEDKSGTGSPLYLSINRVGITADPTVTTQTSSVIQASTTNANLVIAPNGTGALVAQIPDGTATGGNARGLRAVDFSLSRLSNTSVASGNNSGILSGYNNKASGNSSSITGGDNNVASNQYTHIGGGTQNTTSGEFSTIAGGFANTASGNLSVVSGGQSNTTSSAHSTVSGGQSNTASTNTHATVVGGASNTSSGQYSISGGSSNNASANWSIAFGRSNNSQSTNSFCLGQDNISSGSFSSSIGLQNTASAFATLALGSQSVSYLYAQNTNASGYFAGLGDAQQSILTVRRQATLTTGGTATLSLDGTGTTNLIIPNGTNRMWNVQVRWVAVVTAITGTATGVTVGDTKVSTDLLAVAKRGGVTTVGAHTSAGTSVIETIAGSLTTANITYSAGASQEMAITFTGPTFAGGGSVTMRVVAAISLTEVAY